MKETIMTWKRNHHNMKKKQSNEKETIMIWKRNNLIIQKQLYEKETIIWERNNHMKKIEQGFDFVILLLSTLLLQAAFTLL